MPQKASWGWLFAWYKQHKFHARKQVPVFVLGLLQKGMPICTLTGRREATETALESGMAKGEFAGYFGNLRALTVAVGPFIFGVAHAKLQAVCA